ncbi:MAG: GNAT family N-acetyltransferase [Flavobacteriaceae bacterium]|nr:GNAT family N-acetyltransferase [Flavobacteriaceae bacterium]
MEIQVAKRIHVKYAAIISKTISSSAQVRGTGIALRTPEYIQQKIESGNSIIALEGDSFAGFCYIEAWGHEKYVAHSGLIVFPDFRGIGLAKKIKTQIFKYTKKKYPGAKIFGITTGLPVMKINYGLGYKPVTFSELTDDPAFWKGCQTCKNYDVLTRTKQTMCLCTGMLYDPAKKSSNGIRGSIQSFKKAFKRDKK